MSDLPAPARPPAAPAPRPVATTIGYHGTGVAAATAIVEGGFRTSNNDYDWLGDGVYFFDSAPARAWEWATKQHGASGAVVGAEIELRDVLDLLDIDWARTFADAYDAFLARAKAEGVDLPRQSRGAHRLDREVINFVVENAQRVGTTLRAVRGAFAEGAPLFPNSALLDRAHVQIAVRDISIIRRVWSESRKASAT